MTIKILYCIFLGLLIVSFVGWGVSALYPTPRWDLEYPDVEEYRYGPEPSEPTTADLKDLSPVEKQAAVDDYQVKLKQYEAEVKQHKELARAFSEKTERHGRTVSLISLLFAVVTTALGIGLSMKLPVVSEGLVLGGLFTLIYSIGWSFARSPKIAVIPVGVGLVIMIYLGYKRFVRTAVK